MLTARVDRRIELLSIIFRLAGNPEYNMDNSKSPYTDAVEAHFGDFRKHEAVRKAAALRRDHGISYDAVMKMAVAIDDVESLSTTVPVERIPDLDGRWRVEDVRDFLAAVRSFVKDSDLSAFIASNQTYYETTASRMNEVLARLKMQEWFDSFFGARASTKFELVVGLLNGGNCYGPSIRSADGRATYYAVIGCWSFDKQGSPVFSEALATIIAHEFCHSYTNPIVDDFSAQLQPSAERIFAASEKQMRQQAYGTWRTTMYESLVRACVVHYVRSTNGRIAAQREAQDQAALGFKWVGPLADTLDEYEAHRQQYPAFDAFMPRVVEFFDGYANKIQPTSPHD